MCLCSPSVRTPFCGKPGCAWPAQTAQRLSDAAVNGSFTEAVASPSVGHVYPARVGQTVDITPVGSPHVTAAQNTRPAALTAGPAPVTLEGLAQRMGLSAGEATRLWEDVRANQALLDGCRAHNFERPLDKPGDRIRTRWVCSVCTGCVDASAKLWYERGRDHGSVRGHARAGRSDASRSLEPSE